MRWRRRELNDLDQDIRDHIEREIQDNVDRGMTPEEARHAALRAFGNVALVKEDTRAVWVPIWFDHIVQDVRYALRTLRKNLGFTAVAVTILALGIGINTAFFTIADAMLFGGMPGVDPDGRILYIGQGISYPDYLDFRAQAKSFRDLAFVFVGQSIIALNDERGLPETSSWCVLSTNAFQVLGQRPMLGRDFVPSDGEPGAAPVTILSYGLWTDRYSRNPSVIGETIRINEVPTEVIGVMSPGFEFPLKVSLWTPFSPTEVPWQNSSRVNLQHRDARILFFAFGPMAEGVTIESARAEMKVIVERLAMAYPETNEGVEPPRLFTFTEFFLTQMGRPLITYWTMWGAACFVLLIACANLANLLLARTAGRRREIALRSALGADRWRIIRQLLVESLVLSAIGGTAGLAIAAWLVGVYQRATSPTDGVFQWPYTIDYQGFLYLFGISVVTGLLFGLAPVLRLSRIDINTSLKDGGRGSIGRSGGKQLSAILVTAEMALALALLAAAGLMTRSFLNVDGDSANVGVDSSNILTASIGLSETRYPNREAWIGFWDALKLRVEAVQGVESVAVASSIPAGFASRYPYEVEGAPSLNAEGRPILPVVAISRGYFQTVGARVLSGRPFSDVDERSGIPVVLVNKRLADMAWPREDPLGKRLRLFGEDIPDAWRTVVGIASDIRQNATAPLQSFAPVVYLPYSHRPRAFGSVLVRTSVSPPSLGSAILEEIHAIDANVIVDGPETLTDYLATGSWRWRVNAGLFLGFAAFGLMLAAFGLYAVVAYSVSQRTQEIGIRVALGATTSDIRLMVLKQGVLPLGSGLIIGVAASLVVSRLLQSQLVGISATDPLTLVIASAVLVLAALLGCWIPARRAMRVDPAVALRHD